MKLYTFRTALFIVFLTLANGQLGPLVTVQQGSLQGKKMLSTKGIEFSAFLGVPFGEAPIGALRFQDPVPKTSWSGIYDATKDSEPCSSVNTDLLTYTGVEDCLKLNVYTPKLSTEANGNGSLPVFVFFYGGAFIMGNAASTTFPPQRLMNKEIVLVTPYYRLGPLGFLNTLDSAAPGNAGLRDQVEALRWIQANIAIFGGDRNRVTIGGESAGASSVGYHLLSPLSTGLYRGAIMQSGSAMQPSALEEHPLLKARNLGVKLGCTNQNTTLLVQCLQSKSVEDIVTTPGTIIPGVRSILDFVPSVENRNNGAFLSAPPKTLYSQGRFNKVPVISGVNKDEATGIFTGSISGVNNELSSDNALYKEYYPDILSKYTGYNMTSELLNLNPQTELPPFLNFIKSLLCPLCIGIKSLSDVLSDVIFNAPNDLNVRSIAQQNVPVFSYVFDYAGKDAPSIFGEKVVPHTYELLYLFNNATPTGQDGQMSDTMVQMWTDFITYLNPTPTSTPTQWEKTVVETRLKYLDIGQTSISMKKGYRTIEVFFWNNIFPSFTLG